MANSELIEQISRLLRDHFHPIDLIIRDDSAKHAHHQEGKKRAGAHLHIKITSDIFSHKTIMTKHKMVYEILNPYISGGEIHALSLDLKSPVYD